MNLEISSIKTMKDLEIARQLFVEYADSLGFDLCFQNFKKELSCLPGEYAPPSGCILLAKDTEVVQGCIAVRDMGNSICEMKRFYVRPVYRGSGIGKCLVKAVVSWSKRCGYDRMRLDFVSPRPAARSIYESFGIIRATIAPQ